MPSHSRSSSSNSICSWGIDNMSTPPLLSVPIPIPVTVPTPPAPAPATASRSPLPLSPPPRLSTVNLPPSTNHKTVDCPPPLSKPKHFHLLTGKYSHSRYHYRVARNYKKVTQICEAAHRFPKGYFNRNRLLQTSIAYARDITHQSCINLQRIRSVMFDHYSKPNVFASKVRYLIPTTPSNLVSRQHYSIPHIPYIEMKNCRNVIYCIYHLTSSFIYVGQTIDLIKNRFAAHMLNGKHIKKKLLLGQPIDQKADNAIAFYIARFGFKQFRVIILEHVAKDEDKKKNNELLLKREREWIFRLHAFHPLGLNIERPKGCHFRNKKNPQDFVRRRRAHINRLIKPIPSHVPISTASVPAPTSIPVPIPIPIPTHVPVPTAAPTRPVLVHPRPLRHPSVATSLLSQLNTVAISNTTDVSESTSTSMSMSMSAPSITIAPITTPSPVPVPIPSLNNENKSSSDSLISHPPPSPPEPTPDPNASPHARRYAYRDYGRRIEYLAKLIRSNVFRINFLDPYRTKNLVHMLSHLEQHHSDDLSITPTEQQQLIHYLTTVITSRYNNRWNDTTKEKCNTIFTTGYISSMLDRINLQRILHDDNIKKLLNPVHATMIGEIVVGYKLDRTLLGQLTNVGSFNKQDLIDELLQDTTPCICSRRHYSQFKDPHHQHIITSDLSLILDPELRELMQKGCKFRYPLKQSNATNTFEMLEASVYSFVNKLADRFDIIIDDLIEWREAIIVKIKERIEQLKDHWKERPIVTFSNTTRKNIRLLRKHFVFTVIDKSSNDFSLICKKFYIQRLHDELNTNQTYIKVNDCTIENTIATHEQDLAITITRSPNDIRVQKKILPKFIAIAKLHKSPVAFRFIAASGKCTLKTLSKYITYALKALEPTVHAMWSSVLARRGIQTSRCWIINDATQTRELLRRINQQIKQTQSIEHAPPLLTYDFTTLYTNIDLNELWQRLNKLIRQCFQFHYNQQYTRPIQPNQRGTRSTVDTATTPVQPSDAYTHNNITPLYLMISPKYHRFSTTNEISDTITDTQEKKSIKFVMCEELNIWLTYLVYNTFVTFGSDHYHQMIGIPMGTNCAVYLANYFLFTYELDFICRLVERADSESDTILKSFVHTCRYIDDLFTAENRLFEQYMYLHTDTNGLVQGIYPQQMLTLESSGSGDSVPFLDRRIYHKPVTIKSSDGSTFTTYKYASTIWSKRDNPKFAKLPLTRFPAIDSHLSETSRVNVVTSALYRFARACTDREQFLYHTNLHVKELITKGYNISSILNKVVRFIKGHIPLYCTLSVSWFLHQIKSAAGLTSKTNKYNRFRHRLLHQRYRLAIRSPHRQPEPQPEPVAVLAIVNSVSIPIVDSDFDPSSESAPAPVSVVIDNLDPSFSQPTNELQSIAASIVVDTVLSEFELKVNINTNIDATSNSNEHIIDFTSSSFTESVDSIEERTVAAENNIINDNDNDNENDNDNDSSDSSYDEEMQEHKYDDFDSFNDSFIITVHDQPSQFDSISISSSNRIPCNLHTPSFSFSTSASDSAPASAPASSLSLSTSISTSTSTSTSSLSPLNRPLFALSSGELIQAQPIVSTSGSLISIAATDDHIISGDSISNGNSISDDGVVPVLQDGSVLDEHAPAPTPIPVPVPVPVHTRRVYLFGFISFLFLLFGILFVFFLLWSIVYLDFILLLRDESMGWY